MAKVSLRVYNREIEGLIESGQLDEAIAHCQNILKTFPMHVDTYLLLGKAFLEAKRYADAADIFGRALMAVPDNFVSHVGMSIIRDDEGKLDDAIWHMERAFEVQPSNPAIQGELRRLYGRRDGVEPTKIRLSREALANMYSQGELYSQAIAEIRAVLAEDRNRPDLQVMLARAYFRAGQKVDAASMASTLLKKYNHCLDALRILVDVLPATAKSEDAQAYRNRLQALDPYAAYVTGSVFTSDKVSDNAVSMDRLDYKPGATPISPQPGWATSLGIRLDEDKPAEPPGWMSGETPSAQPPELTPGAPALTPGTPAPSAGTSSEAFVPEWMRSAGWEQSPKGAHEEPPKPFEEGTVAPIEQGEVPDWLKSMAPQGALDAEPAMPDTQPIIPPHIDLEKGDMPDWLAGLTPVSEAETPVTPGEPTPQAPPVTTLEPATQAPAAEADKGELPDWLLGLAPAEGAAGTAAPTEPAHQTPVMKSEEPASENPAAEPEKGELPDWLLGLVPTEEAAGIATPEEPVSQALSENLAEPAPQSPATEPEKTEMPDWLASIDADQPAEATPTPVEPTTQTPAMEPDKTEFPDWLASLGANPPAEQSPATPEPAPQVPAIEPEKTELPDWLASLDADQSSEPTPSVQEPAPQTPTVEPKQTDLPDWLVSLDAHQPGGAGTAAIPDVPKAPVVEPVKADLPDWLKDIIDQPPAAEGTPHAEPAPEQPVEPSIDSKPSLPEELGSAVLGAGPVAAASELIPPKPPTDEQPFPDWLTGSEEEVKETTTEPVANEPAPAAATLEAEAPIVVPPTPESLPVQQVEQPVEPPIQDQAPAPAAELPKTKPFAVKPAVEEPAPQPTGEAKPLEIGDDMMAWLESLAAKQGAKEEELLTKPADRPTEMPASLQLSGEPSVAAPVEEAEPVIPEPVMPAAAEQTIVEAPEVAEPPVMEQEPSPIPNLGEPLEAFPSESSPVVEAPVPFSAPVEETHRPEGAINEMPDWLSDLKDDKGRLPDDSLPRPAQEPIEVPPAEEKIETPPAWLEQPVQEPGTPAIQAEATPAEPVTPNVSLPAGLPAEDDITITGWLNKLDVDEALMKAKQVPEAEPTPESSVELPDWLQDLEKPAAERAAGESSNLPADVPDWLSKPAQPIDQENLPSAQPEAAPEQELPGWMEETADVTEPPAPTAPQEWVPVEEKPAMTSAPQTQTHAPIPTAPASNQVKDADLLAQAQTDLEKDDLAGSMKKYGLLIKKGRLLEQVIHDLKEALYHHPVDIIVWQTLGDAYMRANHLQDALDAYTKAEELLR